MGATTRHEARNGANPRLGVPLTVGPVTLSSNLLLAPIAGYCDLAFRVVCREQRGPTGEAGLGLACTDLLSPHGLLRGSMHSLDLAMTNELDRPICMQLYGAEGDILADGARWAVDHGASVVDINMGCPVDKVTKKNGGSTLLRDPCNTVKMAEMVVRAVESASAGRVPVTAKMRLGWCDNSIVAPQLARDLERAGIRLVTVHGRTTEQKFTGSVRPDGIARVVEAVDTIPVLGNGDVTTPQGVIDLMERTGCAGVMIGRGALSSPWIFAQAWALQRATTDDERAAALEEPTLLEKIAIVRRYLDLMLEYRGERYAMNHIRRRITWFAKKFGPCKPLRERVRIAENPGAVHAALDEFAAGGLRWYSQPALEVDDQVEVAS
ncbi:MAG TPA: tRNA-dihydrouridine synthase [Phycisphaerales bacterium]|nr:tRNA-dihydrouridine synthase [Phycisphaerales bacterium]